MTGSAREAPSAYSAVTVTLVVPLSSPTRSTSARRLMAGSSSGTGSSSTMVMNEGAMLNPAADEDTLTVSSSLSASEAVASVNPMDFSDDAENGASGLAVMLMTKDVGVKSAPSAEPPAAVPSAANATATETFSVIGSAPAGKVAVAVKSVVEPSVTRAGATVTRNGRGIGVVVGEAPGSVMATTTGAAKRKLDMREKVSASIVSPGLSGSGTSGSRDETEIAPNATSSPASTASSSKAVRVKEAEPLREPLSISTSKSSTLSKSAPAVAEEEPSTPTRTRKSWSGASVPAGREAVTCTSDSAPSATDVVSADKEIRLSSSMMDR